MKRIGICTVIALVTVLALSTSATAAKGGNGQGKGHQNSTSTAWVSASPNPAEADGSRVEVTGCGFAFAPVELHVVHSAGYTDTWAVGVWSTGCMNPTPIYTSEEGTYTIEVYQASSPNVSLKASTTLQVQ